MKIIPPGDQTPAASDAYPDPDATPIPSAALEAQLLGKLEEMWKVYVDALPRGFSTAPALDCLHDYDRENAEVFTSYAQDLIVRTRFRTANGTELGMNSPGILWDRLTILICKLLFTSPGSVHAKDEIHHAMGNARNELDSVKQALSIAQPARHILLAKEATERLATTQQLEHSLWSLQAANMAMWINQDLLYTTDVEQVSEQRLREYIKFFSLANRSRNTAIENIELAYSLNMNGQS